MTERFLITGGLGRIGAWTVQRLLAEDAGVVTYDLPGDPAAGMITLAGDVGPNPPEVSGPIDVARPVPPQAS